MKNGGEMVILMSSCSKVISGKGYLHVEIAQLMMSDSIVTVKKGG